ncbi:MAG: acetyl-CoA acetyltransferase [Acidimicrobiales bacterium]|nr:acetyl-CoA acetyltransferase [Acidimicrobiales bacterium]
MEKFESRVIVSGVGLSETGRGLDRTGLDLALDAALAAIGDAGLGPGDIDGIASLPFGDRPPEELIDALGLQIDWLGAPSSGAQLGVIISAAMAIAAGLCRHVLIYRSVQRLGGLLGSASGTLPAPEGPWEWHVPFHEYSAVNLCAMQARRHMHQYGTTKEQLGWVAMTCRRHAALNDKAVIRSPLSMRDYLDAPMISDPLGRLDCDLPIDAAVGLVLSSSAFVADCPNPPVRIEAVGCANHGPTGWETRLDFPTMAARDAAAQMWSRTDLGPADVDVAEVYDGFTILTLSWLEALGFCAEGEAGPFVDGGARIQLGGELPLNTYGGQLSAGRLHGLWLFHEAVLQLRGDAGARQVPGASVAITSAGGISKCGCVLLTR